MCKKIEGIKCPKCGGEPDEVPVMDMEPYFCYEGHAFLAEDGGTSHGYCPFCLKVELDRIILRKVLALYMQ
jgi:Zn-finger nucleic acid-binding protein